MHRRLIEGDRETILGIRGLLVDDFGSDVAPRASLPHVTILSPLDIRRTIAHDRDKPLRWQAIKCLYETVCEKLRPTLREGIMTQRVAGVVALGPTVCLSFSEFASSNIERSAAHELLQPYALNTECSVAHISMVNLTRDDPSVRREVKQALAEYSEKYIGLSRIYLGPPIKRSPGPVPQVYCPPVPDQQAHCMPDKQPPVYTNAVS